MTSFLFNYVTESTKYFRRNNILCGMLKVFNHRLNFPVLVKSEKGAYLEEWTNTFQIYNVLL